MSSPLLGALRRVAGHLSPHRQSLVEAWVAAVGDISPAAVEAVREHCARDLEAMLGHLDRGDLAALLREDALRARELVQAGPSVVPIALALRLLDRCCMPYLLEASPSAAALAECLLGLAELGARRLEVLLRAQEEESGRRLLEAQDKAARSAETAREMARANQELRLAEGRSQHRADQIALMNNVTRRIARIMEPERLMQEAAEAIQAGTSHTYVAVVVVDEEGVLVGRWAGRPGVGRRSAGRTQGPPGGIIGRALRKRAPQVVSDVDQDADYHRDVPLTRSEMVIPLLDDGEAVGAIDVQSETPGAFDLDAVAVGETLAEFLVIGLRNARLLAEARRGLDLR